MILAFLGDDALAKEEALEKAVKDFLGSAYEDPAAKEVLYGDEKHDDKGGIAARIEELCESNSLFCEKRAVVVRNLHKLPKAEQDGLVSYLKSPNPDSGLFLEAEKLDARGALYKAIPKPPGKKTHAKFEKLREYQIPEWIVNRVQGTHGKKINKYTAEYFKDLIGNDTSILQQEITKLCNIIGDENEITYEHVKEHIASQRPATQFDLLEPFGMRNPKEFFHVLPGVLSSGVPQFLIATQLYKHCAKLMRVRSMMNQKLAVGVMAKELGVGSPFIFQKVQKLDAQAPKRDLEKYRQIMIQLSEIEHQCKSGGLPGEPNFEMALMGLF